MFPFQKTPEKKEIAPAGWWLSRACKAIILKKHEACMNYP